MITKMVEKKNILIVVSIILFIFLVVPVTIFKKVLTQYLDFLNIWIEYPTGFIKHRVISKIKSENKYPGADLKIPEFKFVKFNLNISGAKKVFVIGDFNKWSFVNEMNKKQKDGWEIELALIKGRYRYLFVVDDKEILDPLNPEVDYYNGKKVSIIEVK